MKRWSIVVLVFGILLGLGLGVLIGWVIYPVHYFDTPPNALRADYKDQYLFLIASAYAADHNLDRARQRLGALGYPDPVPAVDALAQRLTSEGKDSSVLVAFVTDLRAGDQAAIPLDWTRFEGAGYSLAYPAEWYAYPGLSDIPEDLAGIHYDLILSDAPNDQSPQYATDTQQVRLTVSSIPKPNETLEIWAVRQWAWLNTELVPTTINNEPALLGTPNLSNPTVFQEYLWVEHLGRYYVIEVYSTANDPVKLERLQNVIASLTFR